MQAGIIGLGRMGGNIAHRLLAGGHELVVYDQHPPAAQQVAAAGAQAATDLAGLVRLLRPPRAVWLMLPAGEPTSATIHQLAALLGQGDIVIDGGNTHYRDDLERARALAQHGIHYLDIGTSGGVWGRERGYCLMIGGPATAVRAVEPLLATLAPSAKTPSPDPQSGSHPQAGYLHVGPTGAGHYAKMVHNAIEYGMMQALAEGLHLLQTQARAADAHEQYDFDLGALTETWRHGSVISSWLLDLTAQTLATDAELTAYSAAVADSGEGRWALDTALAQGVPMPVLASALFARFRSRIDPQSAYADRLLSAMRHAFGGHTTPTP